MAAWPCISVDVLLYRIQWQLLSGHVNGLQAVSSYAWSVAAHSKQYIGVGGHDINNSVIEEDYSSSSGFGVDMCSYDPGGKWASEEMFAIVSAQAITQIQMCC